ncbi:MAG: O-antigen ligase family protein [Flavobacteriales bacterium]|nr:O-antigen ligase family protein [Flavobacteriales bacterium]
MAVGLPSSNLLMSIAQIIIATNWVIEGQYANKIKRFLGNKPAIIFSTIFGLHLLGLLYTQDWNYAAWDLRNKVPLLALPFLIGSSPNLSKDKIEKIFTVFVISVVTFSVVCAGELTYINNAIRSLLDLPEKIIMDVRSISHFVSHIRFSLMICLAISWMMYQVFKATMVRKKQVVFMIMSAWLIVFLIIMESVTGLAILFILEFATLSYAVVKQKSRVARYASLVLLIAIPSFVLVYVGNMVVDFYRVNKESVSELPKFTSLGSLYYHDVENEQLENGNYVWRYVCHLEIEPGWEKRSTIPFRGKDKAGQFVEYTLFRYMTSRGLHKDAEGLAQLSEKEISAVENGIANVRFTEVSSLTARIYGIIWQMDDYINRAGDPGGHSLSQRWEFWKTGINVLKSNALFGVGTGDVYNEMLSQYEKEGSLLVPAYRKHPHNQYLSVAIGFGIFGLILFLWGLIYPVYMNREQLNYVSMLFFAITLLSMMTEDTLETQAGVSFVAFFYALLFLSPSEE